MLHVALKLKRKQRGHKQDWNQRSHRLIDYNVYNEIHPYPVYS